MIETATTTKKTTKTKTVKAKATAAAPRVLKTKIAVSELNLRKAATRLLTSGLVSTEVAYIQRVLGTSATQEDVDAKVIAVRALPWASIVAPD
jgi:hypothetical protein